MHRRHLLAAGTVVALAGTATAALASDTPAPEGGASMNITGVGLPVITDGRLRNYVFVTIKMYLGAGQTPETMRGKDPWFRDALVRAAHRVSFAVPDDWTRLNEAAVNGAILAIANVVTGPGSVVRSEVLMQTPRRRTGVQAG